MLRFRSMAFSGARYRAAEAASMEFDELVCSGVPVEEAAQVAAVNSLASLRFTTPDRALQMMIEELASSLAQAWFKAEVLSHTALMLRKVRR